MKWLKRALLMGMVLVVSVSEGTAQVRGSGLGGAFIAVADDASAPLWNAAGLGRMERQEYAFSYEDPFGVGLKTGYFFGVLPILERHAVGASFVHKGFDDDGKLSYTRDLILLSYGVRIHRRVSFGLSGKYVRVDTGLDGHSEAKGSGLGLDVGLLAWPTPGWSVGVVCRDVTGTSLRYNTDVSEEVWGRRIGLGWAYQPLEGLTVAGDVDQDGQVRVGTEYWLSGSMALRGGMRRDWTISESSTYSMGVSLRYRSFRLDYAYEHHTVLPGTQQFALSFFYSPSVLRIQKAALRHRSLFRSLYRHYEAEQFVDVELKNSAQERIRATVQAEVPTMMDMPYETEVVVPPQATAPYSFRVTFSDTLLVPESASYDRLVQPTVRVSYVQDRDLKHDTKKLEQIYVLGRGKISWDPPDRIVAFITVEAPPVERFARGLVARYERTLTEQFGRSNMGKAMMLFDALGAYGIRYSPDRRTPYVQVAGDRTILDTVQYPGELFEVRIGDCDDLTVLYAALLENIGIQTVLLDVHAPDAGHVYLMFDSGVAPGDAVDYFLDASEYVLWRDRIWIPVETTLSGSSFFDAWRNGAEEYVRRTSEETLSFIDVEQAQQTYVPGRVRSGTVGLPGEAEVDALLASDLAMFEDRVQRIASWLASSLERVEGWYTAGAYYLRIGYLGKAEEMMERVLESDPGSADAYNALGVIWTHRRAYEKALAWYHRALDLDPQNAGFQLNIALTYYLQGKRIEAENAYERVLELDRRYEEEFGFLRRKMDERKGGIAP